MATDPDLADPPPAAPADEARLAAAIAFSGLLHAICNRMTASGTATYGHFGLGLLEARLVHVLAHNPPTSAARLAVRLSVDPAAVSRAVTRLASRNLIARPSAPQLGLTLTPQGLALAEDIGAAFDERCLRLVEGITTAELRAAEALLTRAQGNLDHVAALGDEVRGGDGAGQCAV